MRLCDLDQLRRTKNNLKLLNLDRPIKYRIRILLLDNLREIGSVSSVFLFDGYFVNKLVSDNKKCLKAL